jgi:hypothetical protein
LPQSPIRLKWPVGEIGTVCEQLGEEVSDFAAAFVVGGEAAGDPLRTNTVILLGSVRCSVDCSASSAAASFSASKSLRHAIPIERTASSSFTDLATTSSVARLWGAITIPSPEATSLRASSSRSARATIRMRRLSGQRLRTTRATSDAHPPDPATKSGSAVSAQSDASCRRAERTVPARAGGRCARLLPQ